MKKQFFGKFRGVVTDNQDPLKIGRIRARVSDVMGDRESGWAMPCFPFVGRRTGFFALPSKGAGVWIEFEHGDPDYPIWSGCWYGTLAEVPSEVLAPPNNQILLMTEGGTSIVLDDTLGIGGITLKTASGQKVKLSATGIEIDNGLGAKITMEKNQVNVNNGALEVI